MTYNFRTIVNHVLRKTEFGPVSETIESQFTGNAVDPLVDRIKDWTNEVYIEMCNLGYWRFLEAQGTITTSAGVENYSLPSNCQANRIIDVMEMETPSLLKRTDFKAIDDRYPDTTLPSRSIPDSYYFVNNSLYLFPVPETAITIKFRYYKTVSELVNATDVPEIPEHWKWVLVNGILVRANQYLQDQSTGDAQLQYLTGLIQMRAENRADRQNKKTIRPY